MGFWGIEVKPGKPYPYHSDDVPGRLHVTQATLGVGSSKERSIVQCTIGHKSPVFLCSLLPNRNESCSLNLEFDEDDLVAFSVIGPRSVHLSGYFEAAEGDGIRDDYESDLFGEDIADSGSDESDSSDEFDTSDEYADEFSDGDEDDDFGMYDDSSPVRKSGVVIEEIVDDKEPENGSSQSKQLKKKKRKKQPSGSVEATNSQQQIIVRGESEIPVLESEDEDGFPISDKKSEKTEKKKAREDCDGPTSLKRKVESTAEEGRPEKKKKNKNKKQPEKQAVDEDSNEKQSDELVEKQADEKNADIEKTQVQSQSEDKKKKKKNKKGKVNEEGTTSDQTVTAKEGQKKPSVDTEQKQTEAKSSQVRTFPNGLIIEEVSMGKPDGKRASPGKMVHVHYIGKLKKNGKIFDSNVGRAPFKFRLGTGQVISGWDVGVNGMRVGDKRRLTIPPEMGYGSKGAGGAIPPNSWLMFDVELFDVR